MAFSIVQQVVKRDRFPGFGTELKDEVMDVTLTYEAIGLTLSSRNEAVAQFDVSTENAFLKGSLEYYFVYSGEGNPLVEAEAKYKTELTGISL